MHKPVPQQFYAHARTHARTRARAHIYQNYAHDHQFTHMHSHMCILYILANTDNGTTIASYSKLLTQTQHAHTETPRARTGALTHSGNTHKHPRTHLRTRMCILYFVARPGNGASIARYYNFCIFLICVCTCLCVAAAFELTNLFVSKHIKKHPSDTNTSFLTDFRFRQKH